MQLDLSPAALAALTQAVGPAHLLTSASARAPYAANVSGLRRDFPAVVLPGSTTDVQRVVLAANQHGLSLFPFSRGRNWGLGSRLPAREGSVLVDLSRMQQIREVNAELGYAVVEPGVTQRQLHAYLVEHKLPLALNVIGSALDSSLLGNALERGIGYFATRAGSLSGLEVVLGNGTLLKTGFAHYEQAQTAHVYKHGIGPGLDGLFYQSNFGIVCSAGIELIRRHGLHRSAVLRIQEESQLAGLVDALADLRRREVLRMVVHIGNRARTYCTLAPLVYEQLGSDRSRERAERLLEQEGFGPWSAVAGWSGTPAEVRAVEKELARVMRGKAQLTFLDDQKLARAERLLQGLSFLPGARRKGMILKAMAPIYGLSHGIPTDAALKSVYWASGLLPPEGVDPLDPDQGESGQLYFLPMMPLSGAVAAEAVALVQREVEAHRLVAPMTLNLLDDRCLEIVLSLAFRRDRPEEQERAHQCLAHLEDQFMARGWPPYRVGLQSLGRMVKPGDPFWETARAIKRVLDPIGVIAPGRYSLD